MNNSDTAVLHVVGNNGVPLEIITTATFARRVVEPLVVDTTEQDRVVERVLRRTTFTTKALDAAIEAWFKGCDQSPPLGHDPQDWMRTRMFRALTAAAEVSNA